MIRKKISPQVSALVLVSLLSLVGVFEGIGLKAQDPKPQIVDAQYCLKCHSNAAMVQKMRVKEGQSRFLFDAKGNLRSCPAQQPKPTPSKSW